MRLRKYSFMFLGAGFLLLVTAGLFFLLPARPVSAQCGSSATSCKNCHETQQKDPVNNDGTAWHGDHSAGDYCAYCHAGNSQATDETAAHTGLVEPLADIEASCQACHAGKLPAFAEGYAATLKIALSTESSSNNPAPAPVATANPSTEATPAPTQAQVVLTADMIDYSQRYDEIALGKKPVNLGNIIGLGLLAVLVLGGGFFVLIREGIIHIAFEDPKRVTVEKKYPADVVEMLPSLLRLKPEARKSLQTILAKPAIASELFGTIERFGQTETIIDDEEGPSVEESPKSEK